MKIARRESRLRLRVMLTAGAVVVGLVSPALAVRDAALPAVADASLPVLHLILGFGFEADKQEFVSVPDDPELDFGSTDQMTLSVWVKLSERADTYHILSKRDFPCGDMNYHIARDLGGIHFVSGSGEGSSRVDTTLNDLSLGVLTHIVVTYADSTLKIYVNSKLVGSASPYELQAVNDAPLLIGGSADCGDTFPGTIHLTSIYRRVVGRGR